MKEHQKIMHALSERHEMIAELLHGKKFHYIDIPIHDNIGDLLIMQGTLAFFKKYRLKPKTISSALSFKFKWVKDDDVLVFHGGGNFGDLYQNINELREEIVRKFSRHRIIILPQTIFFASKEREERAVRIFKESPDVHLFVRDKISFEIGSRFTDKVYLTPDMAHQLYPIRYLDRSSGGSVRIQRVDLEQRPTPDALKGLSIARTTDWVEVIGKNKKWIDLVWKIESRLNKMGLHFLLPLLGPMLWIPIAQKLTNQAIDLFSHYESVVTDRLHGHILACLMNRKNIVIDNSYGKNSTYIEQWTIASDIVNLCKDKS